MKRLIFLFFILAFNSSFSQIPGEYQLPLITNYSSRQYSANVQNWGIIQDTRGIIYIANGDGVLEYDGVTWRLISIPNNTARCLAIDENGTIFIGGINEIGYLAPDEYGLLKYVSLNKFIVNDKADYGDVWRIIVHDDGLYFSTFSSLYLLESNKDKSSSFLTRISKRPSVKRWEARTRFNPIHNLGKRIFVHERNIGLHELVNGSLKLLPGGEQFAQDLICIMLPYTTPSNSRSDKILIGSLRRGLFLFDGKGFTKFINEADNYLIVNRLYYKGALLQDGSYALGTQVGGIVIIDQTGKLKRIFNINAGLLNNTVWDIYPDTEGNLWAALDNGISKIYYPSPSYALNEKSGFEGSINAIKKFNGSIYLAASTGIYFQDPSASKSGKIFSQIKNTSVQSWDLLPLNNSILAATNDGVLEIKNNIPSNIDVNLRYVYKLYRPDSSFIYSGLHSGLAVLKIINNSPVIIGSIPNFKKGIMDIQEDENGYLWLNEITGGITRLKIPHDRSDLSGYVEEPLKKKGSDIIKMKFFKYQNKIYFFNNKLIYEFDKPSDSLVPSGMFSYLFKDTTEQIIHIYNPEDKLIWLVINADGKKRVVETDPKNRSLFVHSFLEMTDEGITADFSLLKLYADENRTLWVSTGDHLIHYDISHALEYKSSVRFKPLIRKVSAGSKVIFFGYKARSAPEGEVPEIYYSDNSLIFDFASPSYIKESGSDYQYMLEGFTNNWSRWSRETRKEYTNLPPGTFTFRVRTRSPLGELSEETFYKFEILPPWYKTWWANLLGFIIILLFINYIIRFRVRYLKNKNLVLERMVNERTAKINEQKAMLEEQAKKLLELDQMKSNFFTNISHEFRTPLTLIKGQLENVLGLVEDEKIKNKISIAFNNSNRLNNLINKVLDLSKIESGKMVLHFEQTDIISLLKKRLASFESLAGHRKICTEFSANAETLIVNIDKEKIEEAADNLLSNAFKFTPQNGTVSLTVNKETGASGDIAVISISDTGIGITEDKLPYIFDRFFQADTSSTKHFEGSGLGLAIVKELITLHGGTLSVKSKVNSGTTFSFTLPVIKSEKVLEADNEKTEVFNDENKPLVLIVEDNDEVRSYIKENLEGNYRIDEAADGEEGINCAVEKIPDLIITDVMMPKVNGFELCTRLKNDQKTSHIPIIILTAKADREDKLDGLQIGADEFLAKPFSPKELEVRLQNLIKMRQLLRKKYKEVSVISSEDIKGNPLDKEFLQRVFSLIKNNVENNQFSVSKLAEEMTMSVSQLNRKLNALINQSAGKLIRSTKLDYAAKLLEKNAGNISEIGYRVGFSDLSSFTASFKEKFSLSPSEYLKNMNEKTKGSSQ